MIKWNNCSYAYGVLEVIREFTLEAGGEGTTVLLGPSGCGKTTLLHLAAGLLDPLSGTVQRGSERLSYLFQEPRLLPWKSVRENIAFALDESMEADEKEQRCNRLISWVGLEGFEEYRPSQLSGGMEQRCAIARAFAPQAPLLLMDEPFKGLDLKLKMPLITLLNSLLAERKTAAVLVTHDVREAILMGDRILFLDGPPLALKADLEGLDPEERDTSSRAFYDLEKRLYSLILEE
ncbi:MAG: ABC transporter ATP-binding protein [Spirochaetales bacterium]|nr:ABC transporter ATP-binding protein [Spirochaetales bacterium]